MSTPATAERLWGCGDLDVVFGAHPKVVAPWPAAPRRKHHPKFDADAVARLTAGPPDLVEVDPRSLWASQPWVLRCHADYYLTGRWERTGLTSADRHLELNRFPVVVADHRDRSVIVSGHHRATVALAEGRPLLVRRPATGPRHALTPLLWWDPTAAPVTVTSAVRSISAGERCDVPDRDVAQRVLAALQATVADAP